MLLTALLHPEILAALAGAGHGSRVLLADGHYPASTAVGRHARIVYVNLTPGLLDVSTVLDVLLRTVPIEAAAVMVPPAAEPEPEAIGEYRDRLASVPVEELDRFAFYAQARSDDLALSIVTADVRTYANLLLTIGVRNIGPAADSSAP
jgi:L-fucose mutarotase